MINTPGVCCCSGVNPSQQPFSSSVAAARGNSVDHPINLWFRPRLYPHCHHHNRGQSSQQQPWSHKGETMRVGGGLVEEEWRV